MPGWVGEGWWSNEMIKISGTPADEDNNDCSVQLNPDIAINFTNTATGVWTADDARTCTLTYSGVDDEFVLTWFNGNTAVFHDLNVADVAGRIKRIEDAFGNDLTYTYSGSELDYIVADVVEGVSLQPLASLPRPKW